LNQREKCVKVATALVEEGTSVVVGTYIWDPNHACMKDVKTKVPRQYKRGSRHTRSLGQTSSEAERTDTVRPLYGIGKALRTQ
jgi:hypothetical protein